MSSEKPVDWITVKNFVDTVHQMRKGQMAMSVKGSKIDPVDVKRLENAVDIRIGMMRELLEG